ncbi:hypothetical protein Dimus_032436 [Dionaea muscipula]
MQQRIGKRLVFFPSPLQGHLTPLFQLANILYSNGFSISIIHTQFNAPNAANHPNFTFHPISECLSETEASMADVIALTNTLNVKCVEPLRDCLSEMLSDGSKEPIACLITDAVWHFSQAVADSLKLSRVVLRTSNVSAFLALSAMPSFKEKGYLDIKGAQLEAPLPELPPLKFRDIPRINSHNPEAVYDLLSQMSLGIKNSSGLIFNSFEELEDSALAFARKEFGVPIFPLGPFHKSFPMSMPSTSLLTPDESCISWLNKQAPKSVLYVSFGSIAAINEEEFQEIAWGLANSKQHFLWVVRPGLVRRVDVAHTLPHGFMEMVAGRGHIVDWAPQQEVLAHPSVAGFWTHNGWNSTFESICEGMPMICLPFFGDQLVNARYVTDVWEVGLRLEKLERGEIEKTIRALMVENVGTKITERTTRLKQKARHCLLEGGSSHRSLNRLVSYILSF